MACDCREKEDPQDKKTPSAGWLIAGVLGLLVLTSKVRKVQKK